jgi:cytochrome c oxidase assembly protein subunit 15
MGLVPAHLDSPHPAPAAAVAATARRGWPGWVRKLADSVLAPSPAAMRRYALAGVLASVFIILTGAAVRLSQSGLGCPDWPQCTAHSLVAGGDHGDSLIHRWIEFGNRLVTDAIFVAAVLVFVAAWRYRSGPEGRRRRDLVWLAAAQPGAIVAQAIIGGIVVLTKLNPGWVSVHYLASAALVAAAVALYVRCQEGTGPARPLVRPEVRLISLAVIAAVALMLAAGTVVTGTGPLAGARSVPRYPLPLTGVTQLHADIGWLLGGLVIALVLALRLSSAPRRAVWLGWLLLALVGVQGSIGYGQYFSGLPAGVVWVHEVGAAAIWVTALLLPYALRERAPGFTDGSQARPATRNPAGIGSIGGEAPPPQAAVPSATVFSASQPSASDRDRAEGA